MALELVAVSDLSVVSKMAAVEHQNRLAAGEVDSMDPAVVHPFQALVCQAVMTDPAEVDPVVAGLAVEASPVAAEVAGE